MRTRLIIGIFLIVFGVIALAYQGITYTTEKKVVDIGPLEGSVEEKKTIPLPPIAGVASLAAGVVLVVMGSKRKQ